MAEHGGIDDEEFSLMFSTPRTGKRMRIRTTKRSVLLLFMVGVFIIVAGFAFFWPNDPSHNPFPDNVAKKPNSTPNLGGLEEEEDLAAIPQVSITPSHTTPASGSAYDYTNEVAKLLVGSPKTSFRDNLRNDTKYITSWVSGGWTNDFMTYINMIYLSILTERTPILPPFAPSHVSWEGGFLPFGDVFDVPRLSKELGKTVLEFRDVKDLASDHWDELGCWSIWSLIGDEKQPRNSAIPGSALRFDVSYTGLPESSTRIANVWLPFWTLAKLSFPFRYKQALEENPNKHENSAKHYLPPDEQLMCFDFMYFVGAQDHDEWWWEWSPAWRFVGTHTHWNAKLQRIAVEYIQKALGVEEDGVTIPPYIGIHVRHGDFATAACGNRPKDQCFHPIKDFADRVAEIMDRLREERGIHVESHHVIVTSDETDPKWWAQIKDLGWRFTNHTEARTEERYGLWYPPLIDAVTQSLGVGFVGTDRSTMTMVAMRRVRDWQHGFADAVPIG